MRTRLIIEIDFDNDREHALRTYAHMVGVRREELCNTAQGFDFHGFAIPSLFTLLRPASVTLKSVKED